MRFFFFRRFGRTDVRTDIKQGFTGSAFIWLLASAVSSRRVGFQVEEWLFESENAVFRVDYCSFLKEIQVNLQIKIFMYYTLEFDIN